jgi:hypothetical protein
LSGRFTGSPLGFSEYLLDRINRIIPDYFFLFQFPDETGKTQSAFSGIKWLIKLFTLRCLFTMV